MMLPITKPKDLGSQLLIGERVNVIKIKPLFVLVLLGYCYCVSIIR